MDMIGTTLRLKATSSPFALACALGLALAANPALAEEGGSGHYLPGSIASFMDGVSPTPALITRINVLNYQGSAGKDVAMPIGGRTALGADADSWGYAFTMFWRPKFEIGEGWSYAMSATIPYITMEVSANTALTLPSGATAAGPRKTDRVTGLGDVVLMPLMFNYIVDPDFNVNFRVTGYAPTGSYQVGRLANTGKNFWTVEPTLGLMYFGQKNGREASVFIGADFNQENPDTKYKSGTQFHVDGTVAQHFPFAGGLAGAGVNAFYYKQVTDDSGAGATFGAFRAKTVGLGPALSYIRKLDGADFMAELKWLHESGTEKRLKGDSWFLKAMLKF